MPAFFLNALHFAWLPVASFFAGVLNTVAGGGSFLSLPALLASTSVLGVGAVTAQATNTVELWPGQLTSLVAFRQQLRSYGWSLLPLGAASGGGGWADCFCSRPATGCSAKYCRGCSFLPQSCSC